MSDAETPMTTRKEVRQRRYGLYWLVALLALIVLGLALFGFADDLTDDGQPLLGGDVETSNDDAAGTAGTAGE